MEEKVWIEMEPNFFDSEEERERKRRELQSLTELEKAERKAFYERLKDVQIPDSPSLSEKLDMLPSVFDDACAYDRKRETYLAFFPNAVITPRENVFLCPERTENVATKSKEQHQNFVIVETDEKSIDNFVFRNGCLIYLDVENEREIRVGNFWISIVREVVHVKAVVTEQNVVKDWLENSSWKVEILCAGQKYHGAYTVTQLNDLSVVLKCTRDRGYLFEGKGVRRLYTKYIHELVEQSDFRTEYIFDSTGWINYHNQGWAYLTDIGVIGRPDLLMKADVPYHFQYDKKHAGTKRIFQEFYGLRFLCTGKVENSTFLMHLSCLAVMTTLFQEVGYPINFVTAVIGPTNSQKTSTTVIFSKLFDRTVKAIPDIRFNSTPVAIEEKMESYGDAILLVDDFLPYENKSQICEQLKKSEQLIRGYGDRTPRKRSKEYAERNGVPQYSAIKGLAIITGEVFDTNSESSATRVIQLEFSPGDVDLEALSFYQKNLMNVPTFLYDFISYLQENVEKVFETIATKMEIVRREKKLLIATPRFRDTYGIFSTEIEIFYRYAVERGFLTVDEAMNEKARDLQWILQIIEKNDKDTKLKSPAGVIFYALYHAMWKGIIPCRRKEEIRSEKECISSVIDTGEYLCILPELLWKLYRDYCIFISKERIYKNGRELSAPLKKEKALLLKDENGNERATHKFSGYTQKRFFYIRKSIFEKITQLVTEY